MVYENPLTTNPQRCRLESDAALSYIVVMDPRTDLATYLSSRHIELGRKRDRLEEELADLYLEIDDIEKAATAVGIDLSSAKPDVVIEKNVQKKDDLTIKEAALDVLVGQSNGLTAHEILDLLEMIHGMKYMRSSLSPQLSRLKSDGKITLHGGKWYLANPTRANHE